MQGTLQTTTTFSIEGYRITEYKGLVRGSSATEVLCYGTAVVIQPS